jgi:hypothetical protein
MLDPNSPTYAYDVDEALLRLGLTRKSVAMELGLPRCSVASLLKNEPQTQKLKELVAECINSHFTEKSA